MTISDAAIPTGFSTVTPYLVVDDADAAINFYKEAFGATETFRVNAPSGRVGHVEIRIGNSLLMLGESSPEWEFMNSAATLGGSPVNLYLYLPDADAVFDRAISNGAEVVMSMEDHSDGDRRGGIRDPFGLIWWLATAQEENARERLIKEKQAG